MADNSHSRTKIRQCVHSMFSKTPECFVCGTKENLEFHHIFGGKLRSMSDKYGLTVCLCRNHHRGDKGVHGKNKTLDIFLKTLGAIEFSFRYSYPLFLNIFGDDSFYSSDATNLCSGHHMKTRRSKQ